MRSFECLGACDIAPMASVNGEYVGPLTTDDCEQIVEDLQRRRPVLPDKQLRYRACVDPGVAAGAQEFSVPEHPGQRRHRRADARRRVDRPAGAVGATRDRTGEAGKNEKAPVRPHRRARAEHARGLRAPRRLRVAAQGAGDAARGGARRARRTRPSAAAAAPASGWARRSSFLPKGDMDKYLVCNADESEPGTFKDRELMQKSPHMLIEGIVIAAYAGEIDRAFIYIRGEYELQADILEAAIAEAAQAGYLGENILGSGIRPVAGPAPRRRRLHLRRGDRPARLARGQARQPAAEAPVPGDRGPVRRPDADQQRRDAVDRARRSSAWAATSTPSIGTETSTGTKLVSISGDVKRPGNYEIELGIPSREIIYGLAGGPPSGRDVKFWFPGGSSSPVLTKDDLDVPYDFDSMAKAGSMLGSGAIIVADESRSVLDDGAQAGQVLRARVVRQVRPVPRGHQLDPQDAAADPGRRGDADGPRHHGLGSGADHRQLPVRARRRDGDADRLDGREVPSTSSRPRSRPRASAPTAAPSDDVVALGVADEHAGTDDPPVSETKSSGG